MVIPLWKTIMSVETNETMAEGVRPFFADKNNPSPEKLIERTRKNRKHITNTRAGSLFALNGEMEENRRSQKKER